MVTIASVLKRSFDDRAGEQLVTLDPALQGLPDTAHGGSVLAVFDAVASVAGTRAVGGTYRRRVPLGVPLALAHGREGNAHVFALRGEDGSVLVDGRVAAARGATDDLAHAAQPAAHAADGHRLPISRACFACGTDNPLGLQVQLAFDETTVSGAWTPREPFRDADDALAPAALTTLLDEAAFWLGALATGESGMTTVLDVTLHRRVPFGTPITVAGRRASARPRPDDRRYWDTEVAAYDSAGARVASGRITFVAVRGAARRLVAGMLALNDAAIVRRVFPAYAPARA